MARRTNKRLRRSKRTTQRRHRRGGDPVTPESVSQPLLTPSRPTKRPRDWEPPLNQQGMEYEVYDTDTGSPTSTPIFEPPLNQQGMDWNLGTPTVSPIYSSSESSGSSLGHSYDEGNRFSCAKCAEIYDRIGSQDAQYQGADVYHDEVPIVKGGAIAKGGAIDLQGMLAGKGFTPDQVQGLMGLAPDLTDDFAVEQWYGYIDRNVPRNFTPAAFYAEMIGDASEPTTPPVTPPSSQNQSMSMSTGSTGSADSGMSLDSSYTGPQDQGPMTMAELQGGPEYVGPIGSPRSTAFDFSQSFGASQGGRNRRHTNKRRNKHRKYKRTQKRYRKHIQRQRGGVATPQTEDLNREEMNRQEYSDLSNDFQLTK